MTSGADDTSLQDRALEAMHTAVDALHDAHSDADNAAAAGAAEQEHVNEFVDVIAEALVEGLNQPVGFYAAAVAEETRYFTKTDLKQHIKDRSEQFRGGDNQPLDKFVEQRLESVTVVKTTDHRQGAEYIWDFGTFKVETRSGTEGRGHNSWPNFREFIHESGGVNLARPVKQRRDGEAWRDFILGLLDQRGKETYTRGPRTKAYESLSNKLKRLTGYGTPEGALDHTGIWIIRKPADLPEWWDRLGNRPASEDRDLPAELVNEVRVHESVIEPILDDADITRSAFYHELNARNLTVPGTSGASMTKWVNGSEERFWTLLPDIGTPRTYIPDVTAGEQVHTGTLLSDDAPSAQADDQPQPRAEVDGGESRDGFDSVGDAE